MFESSSIKSLDIRNRFIRTAVWEGMADQDGAATDKLTRLYKGLVHGGVGLIITGCAFTSPEGRLAPWQLGMHSDDVTGSFSTTVAAVHKAGCQVCAQIGHAGGQAVNVESGEGLAPSDMKGRHVQARAMSRGEIGRVVEDFAAAAARAKNSGCDAVQIHAAHGYLVSQFLSPHYNKREDDYGGNPENRSRLLAEILNAVRQTLGDDYPILVKMNCADYLQDGFGPEDLPAAIKVLEQNGADALEVSGGTLDSRRYRPVRMGMIRKANEGYYRVACGHIREMTALPLVLTGGIRSFENAEKFVAEKKADYIGLGRPLIREPALVKRWKDGNREPAQCRSENMCFQPAFEGRGIYCLLMEKQAARANKNQGADA